MAHGSNAQRNWRRFNGCVNQQFIPRWQNSGSNGQTLTDLAMPDALAPRFQPEYRPTLSVVIPALNEAEGIVGFHRRLVDAMEPLGSWEAIYIDDGSDDATRENIEFLRLDDPRIALISLSRNFGKEIATTAGLDHARGEVVIVIDADLQDPPEVIPELVAAWRQGLRHGLRPQTRSRGRNRAQETDRTRVLPADAPHRSGQTAAGYRRFPPHEPACGGSGV